MKTVIHVNQHVIKANKKNKKNDPVFTVKTYKTIKYGHEVLIKGDSKLVYSPNKTLPCKATAWIETHADVEVINHDSLFYKISKQQKEKKNG